MAGAIDIHTHVVPSEFPAYCGGHREARWPQMRAADCGHRSVIIDGKVFRTVSQECWDIDRRRAAMAASGISRQVLSPTPGLLSYWLAPEDTLSLCRHINDTIGEKKFGVTQLCLGTDHPFAVQGLEPVSRIDALDLTAQEGELLLRSNARRFLGECC